MGRNEYMQVYATYKLFRSLTTWRKSSISMHEPEMADMDAAKAEEFVKEAKEDAAYQYEQYVAKLNKKIGPTKSATLEGNHVWGYSFLRVVTASGEKQTWKTQTIINQSKLGKVFNQFPTRKIKE